MSSFSIVTNLSSLNGQVNLGLTSVGQQKTLARLSSGLRITSAGDDAAGLSVANSFRSDIAGINQGVRNANDGLSKLQVIDSGLQQIGSLLDRARTLATQSASDGFSGDRATLDAEFQKVLSEINRQASSIGLSNATDFTNISNQVTQNIFISGGKSAQNASAASNDNIVQVDLSSTANRVDAASLGLTSTTNTVTGTTPLGAFGAGLASTATITIKVTSGASQPTFVVNLSGALNGNDVVSKINAGAGGFVTASIDSTNTLKLSSAQSFTAQTDAVVSTPDTSTVIGINDAAAAASVSVAGNANITTSANAQTALNAITTSVTNLGKVLGAVGAGQNRLQQAINLANSEIVNFSASESRIRDANIAQEATNLTKFSVLSQAGIAALAQANQASQGVLALLR